MTRVVWRHEVKVQDEPTWVPDGQVLAAQVAHQADIIEVWVLHDPGELNDPGDLVPMPLYVVGTGNPVPDDTEFAVTCPPYPIGGTRLVWHIFKGV